MNEEQRLRTFKLGFLILAGLSLVETSAAGVFAVGDVRAGSLKRVASSVGEGMVAVRFVHQVLGS